MFDQVWLFGKACMIYMLSVNLENHWVTVQNFLYLYISLLTQEVELETMVSVWLCLNVYVFLFCGGVHVKCYLLEALK